jgi:hypothetical protein
MSNDDFEVCKTGTGKQLTLLEAFKTRCDAMRPIVEFVASCDCDCTEDKREDDCITCRARELLKEMGG